jgi:hypothetical protein
LIRLSEVSPWLVPFSFVVRIKLVITAYTARTGAYLEDCQIKAAMPYATDLKNGKKLWRAGEEIVGEIFEI